MTRTAKLLLCLMCAAGATLPARAAVEDFTPAEFAALGAYTPKPEYPLAARRILGERRLYITGHGIFRLHVRISTGLVTGVETVQSTGSAILDASALRTLRKWRFKPEVLRALEQKYRLTNMSGEVFVRVPIRFMM